MKKIRKSAVLLASILLLTGAVSGCSKDEAKNDSGRMDITWTGYQLGPTDQDAVMIQKWNEKFNVNLDIWNIDNNQWDEIINLKLASGSIPDKIRVRDMAHLQTYYKQGVLAKIPIETLEKYAPNLYRKTLEIFPQAFDLMTIDGDLYGIPVLEKNPSYSAAIYRGDWLKALGIDKEPETFEEFEKIMYSFANDDPDGNGKKDTYGISDSGLDAVYGAFGFIPEWWKAVDGQLVYGAVQPEMKEALAVLARWYKDGVIDPEFITGENQSGYQFISNAFVNGRIGYSQHGNWYHWCPELPGRTEGVNYTEVSKLGKDAGEVIHFGKPPVAADGKYALRQGNVFRGVATAFGVQLEEEPEKMQKILEILDTLGAGDYDTHNEAKYGIQGEHWEYDEYGMPKTITDESGNAPDVYKIGAGMLMVSEYILPDGVPELPYQQWLDDNFCNVPRMTNDLLVSLPSASKYLSELDKLREETYVAIITGGKPVDYFDEFVKQWREMGGAQLEKEAQEWYSSLDK